MVIDNQIRKSKVEEARMTTRESFVPPASAFAPGVPPEQIVPRGYVRPRRLVRSRPGFLRKPVFGLPCEPHVLVRYAPRHARQRLHALRTIVGGRDGSRFDSRQLAS